ncbi:unnamed protein product [Parnassius mnemosyne]|uniref:Regulatory protein zeste n=1 Tax=Parnassius mnemosyne TaxID=213953 RepID=A0AAV1LU24_9NEOP
MTDHGDLSNPRCGPQGRLKSERLWCELAVTLNSIGGGVNKSADKWKKVWADWKSKTEKKASLIRRHASGTGGGPSIRQTLTAFEERVLAIMGNLTVDGLPSIQEQGFGLSQVISSPTLALSPPPATHQQDTVDCEITTANLCGNITTCAHYSYTILQLAATAHPHTGDLNIAIHEEFKSATCTFYPSADLQATIPTNPELWDNCFPHTNVSKGSPEAYTHTIRQSDE